MNRPDPIEDTGADVPNEEAGRVLTPINVFDVERLALERLPKSAGDYYRSGARDEVTLRANREAFAEVFLRYRVMAGSERRDTATTAFGSSVAMPIGVAPTAFHKLAHPEGEVGTARAAGKAGALFVLSTLSNSPVEEVVAASTGPVLFQLYVYRDRGATKALVERVVAAGAKGILLTADAAILGTRERDVRNGFKLPPGLDMPNANAQYRALGEAQGDSALAAWVAKSLDPALSWDDVAWLREVAGVPVFVKGLVRGDDAARAVDAGASGVVVSNHGGRQLDGAVPTLRALPEVVEAVAGRVPVWMDGGVRRGTDVVKALAMGASFVLVGRPVLYGLAWNGPDGVETVLRMLHAELDEAMALVGARSLAEITADLIAR